MKKGIFTGLILTAALVVLGAACQTATTVNTNSAAGNNAMNRNSMTMTNANSMSNMQMNGNSTAMSNSNISEMAGMSDMKSSPNAASAPYDLQFLDTMSAHHQSAIDMAQTAVGKTQKPELKAFAQKIIVDQKKVIAQMQEWRDKWFKDKPMAMNMEMPGMSDSMKMMSGDGMKKFEAATGNEFDLQFLDMMTPHHQGATVMAKEALTKAEKPEIKQMAQNIIKAQEAEIKQMADWKAKWSK